MNIKMGTQTFNNVSIPILWGTRAVLQDTSGRISVIDLSGTTARLEIVSDEAARHVEFKPTSDGFAIMDNSVELYNYNPNEHLLRSISLNLPDVQITPTATRVGSNVFSGNIVSGFGVGLIVKEDSMGMGAPLPPALAKLLV